MNKPLISKEKFVEIINFMRERDTSFDIIASAMEKVCPGFSVDFVPNLSYNGKIIDLLNTFFPDEQEDSLIEYYVYETNYGTEHGTEFIIVDDGSNDGTKELLKTYAQSDPRIKILTNEKNMGISYSRNRGCNHKRFSCVYT